LYTAIKPRYSPTEIRTKVKKPLMATPSATDLAAPRQRGRRLLQYGLLFVGCLLFLDALVGEKGLVENLKARQQFEAIERSLARLKDDNARLSKEVELLRKDPETIEGIARRELGLMKPGEKLFIIKDAEPTAP
jgi:cell division protein FtsB